MQDGTEEDVPLTHCMEGGTRLRVRPGEKVPVDGLLFEEAQVPSMSPC